MAKLIVTQEDGSKQEVELPGGGAAFVIGRDAGCSLAVQDKKLSRRHCAVQQTPVGRWTICDLGSRNGTRKNGEPIGQDPVGLDASDVVQLGNTRLQLLETGAGGAPAAAAGAGAGLVGAEINLDDDGPELELDFEPAAAPLDSTPPSEGNTTTMQAPAEPVVDDPTPPPSDPAPEPAADFTSRKRSARDIPRSASLDAEMAKLPPGVEFAVVVEDAEGTRRVAPLSGARLSFGKAGNCDLVLPDKGVSGVHGEIVFENGGYLVRDLGSTNGTRLAGRKVTGDGAPLSHGDTVSAGRTRITLKHRDLPLDDDFLSAGGDVSSVPRRRSRTPWGGLLLVGALLAVAAGGAFFVLQNKRQVDTDLITPPSGSLVQSGFSFEGTKVGAAPEAYTLLSGEGRATVTDLGAVSGARSLQLVPDGELRVGLRRSFRVSPGDRLRASVQAKATGDAEFSLQLRSYSRLGNEGATGDESAASVDFIHTAATAWQQPEAFSEVTAVLEVPTGANHLALEMVARGEGQVMIDDVVVVPASSGASAGVGRLSGPYMSVAVDGLGGFLLERNDEPLAQNGAVRVLDAGDEVKGSLRPGSELEVGDTSLAWRAAFAPAGGGEPVPLAVDAEVTARGMTMRISRAPLEPEGGEGEGAEAAADEGEEPVAGGLGIRFEVPLSRVVGAIGVMAADTRTRMERDFDVEDVFQVILGINERESRCSFAVDPPARVSLSRVDGRPTFDIRSTADTLELRWEATFSPDPTRLRKLLEEASAFEQASRYGDALQRYRRVLQEFPFNEAEKARAEVRMEHITERGRRATERLLEQVGATERLGHRSFKETLRRDIRKLEREYAGTSFVEDLAPVREELEEEMDAEDAALRESAAARLFQSGQDFLEEGFERVGRAKLEECVALYGGSEDDPGYTWAERSREMLGDATDEGSDEEDN